MKLELCEPQLNAIPNGEKPPCRKDRQFNLRLKIVFEVSRVDVSPSTSGQNCRFSKGARLGEIRGGYYVNPLDYVNPLYMDSNNGFLWLAQF